MSAPQNGKLGIESQNTANLSVALDDKYVLNAGRGFLSGTQALVRLPLIQRRRDALQGLNTAGFISGYRGSPIGMYDTALQKARKFLELEHIRFQPGLNEDLAATAVWGSQQVGGAQGANYDGVFGMWYGKAPGVDRSMDALKHANAAGTSRYGGVLAIAGDDHACQSSTLPSQSEHLFESAMIPLLAPANVQDYLDLGILGFGLSRFSGCWVGLKAVAETIETSTTVDLDINRVSIVSPEFEFPPEGVHLRWPDAPLASERRLLGPKLAAVAAFAGANHVDKVSIEPASARLAIVTAGKSYLDVRQAFRDMGLNDEDVRALGIRLVKIGLAWPLQRETVRMYCQGVQDVLVVEEKRAFIESQLKAHLYDLDAGRRPSVVGKMSESGVPLLPPEGSLSPLQIARAIVSRLEMLGADEEHVRRWKSRLDRLATGIDFKLPDLQRIPFFCSGCPHNTSTRVPDGSRAGGGIGCHGLAQLMPDRKILGLTQMGGEGANIIGMQPFTSESHVFQNIGDGTYTHSGVLAIRAAVAADINITYKILYNHAVAMTGGQTAEGEYSVAQIAEQVIAEGVKRVVIVVDDKERYSGANVIAPHGVPIFPREQLDAVQRDLRETKGVTVLIYDQTCAAEKRRRRKNGSFPDPQMRVFINEEVCEGCGDCSSKSNCISVQPIETEHGRKRVIDQSACNKDYSCLQGFCPSFVSVHGGAVRKASEKSSADGSGKVRSVVAVKPADLDRTYSIVITGVGGTGILTIGALLGMAAHLEGKAASVLDNTGAAQKNGPVTSHIRLAPRSEDLGAPRILEGNANLILAADMVVAAGKDVLLAASKGETRAVVNTHVVPMGGYVMNTDLDFQAGTMRRAIELAVGDGRADFINASSLATGLTGDSIATNIFLLGYAYQKGRIPLDSDSIVRAIELNGVAIETNKRVFHWGRIAAENIAEVEALAQPRTGRTTTPVSLQELVNRRIELLTAYQNKAYANRYADFISEVRKHDPRADEKGSLTEAVAINLYKLMAYKDEYEVARLYTDGGFNERLKRQFDGEFKVTVHLAPPLLSKRNANGHLVKREFGPWVFQVFAALNALRGLRGTMFDIFGYTAERKLERELIVDYVATIGRLLARIDDRRYPTALALAELPSSIRGFGHVKEERMRQAETKKRELLELFDNPVSLQEAAE